MDKKIVLLVDDDADITKVLKVRIEAEGYEFLSAGDGKEMLAFLSLKSGREMFRGCILCLIEF